MVNTIERCLGSITAQAVDEVIVVDGFSTDGTSLLVDGYPVRHIYDGGNCLAKARNLGLRNCTGDYVVFVDADQWLPTDFNRRLKEILSKRQYDAVFCNEVWVGSSVFADAKQELLHNGLALRYEHLSCPKVYRTSVLSTVGGLNDEYIGAEDKDLWNRVKKTHPSSFKSELTIFSDASHMSVKTEFRRGILGGSYIISYVKCYPSEWEQLSCIPPIGFLVDTFLAMRIGCIKKSVKLGLAALALRFAHTWGYLFGVMRYWHGANKRYQGLQ